MTIRSEYHVNRPINETTGWDQMTPQQKQAARFERWLDAPGMRFKSAKARSLYRSRVTRFINAISLREGDRVPCMIPTGYFPAYYAGYDLKAVMYDYRKQKEAWLKFMRDFGDMDTFGGPGLVLPAPARVVEQGLELVVVVDLLARLREVRVDEPPIDPTRGGMHLAEVELALA